MVPFYKSFTRGAAVFIAALALAVWTPAAQADAISTSGSPYVLQQALATHDAVNLYDNKGGAGLNLSGGFFSGYASGFNSSVNALGDANETPGLNSALAGDQRVYALLIDGSYDFNYDLGTGLPLRPHMSGGLGMAMYDNPNAPSAGTLGMQGGDMVPLFRLGGGVTYRLGEKWDLSLDYKQGFTGGGDQIFTGRGQQPVDLQMLDMGMHYQF